MRFDLNYDIDGVVVAIDDIRTRAAFRIYRLIS